MQAIKTVCRKSIFLIKNISKLTKKCFLKLCLSPVFVLIILDIQLKKNINTEKKIHFSKN